MRLLHTSDWHLGQTFHDFERRYEHQCFLDWLLNTLKSERIDALLIAGDVFDHANPSADSQKQLYRFLAAAKHRVPHLNIVMIAGNHDSPGRLEAPAALFNAFNATVIGTTPRDGKGGIDGQRWVVPLKNRMGEIAAWGLAIPFLRPGDVPRVETEANPYWEGVKALYQNALQCALNLRKQGQAIVALGHCHMSGGLLSAESERPIIGGAEALPVEIFDPAIAYVALGHLHRAQKVGSQERVRYSGSPLPMSFTEIDYSHQVLRIDLDGEQVRDIQSIRVPRFVDLLRIPARPAALDEVLAQLAALSAPDLPLEKQPYLQVRVLLKGPEPRLRAQIEAALNGQAVRLAKIESREHTDSPDNSASPLRSLDDLQRLQPDDIFKKLHQQKYGEAPSAELLAAFTELLLEPDQERTP